MPRMNKIDQKSQPVAFEGSKMTPKKHFDSVKREKSLFRKFPKNISYNDEAVLKCQG
jgi:hypothetical protein